VKKENVAAVEKMEKTTEYVGVFRECSWGEKKTLKPRCFKKLKDVKRPYKCHYFSNKKAWVNLFVRITNSVLSKLNKRLIWKKRNIILLTENAPCHPPYLREVSQHQSCIFAEKYNVQDPTSGRWDHR
jgi:hypothetical protein